MYGRTEGGSRVRFIGEGSMHPKLCCYRSRSTNFNTVDMQKIHGHFLPEYFVNTFQVKIQDRNKNF